MLKQCLDPVAGYNQIASFYESWHWFGFWRRYEAPLIRDWLQRSAAGTGLDAGTGSGAYLPDIVAAGHDCFALDASAAMLDLARKKLSGLQDGRSTVELVEGDITRLPFSGGSFDWILCARVLSHVDRAEAAIKEFHRVLKPGGECLICDVHPRHPYEDVSIVTNRGRFSIETHKHSLPVLQQIAAESGMRTSGMKEYYLKDLNPPPNPMKFAKIFRHSELPVFYIWRLRKE